MPQAGPSQFQPVLASPADPQRAGNQPEELGCLCSRIFAYSYVNNSTLLSCNICTKILPRDPLIIIIKKRLNPALVTAHKPNEDITSNPTDGGLENKLYLWQKDKERYTITFLFFCFSYLFTLLTRWLGKIGGFCVTRVLKTSVQDAYSSTLMIKFSITNEFIYVCVCVRIYITTHFVEKMRGREVEGMHTHKHIYLYIHVAIHACIGIYGQHIITANRSLLL